MPKAFPQTAKDNKELAFSLIQHLRDSLEDTNGRIESTTRNLDALRSFPAEGYALQHFPSALSNQKGAFLWDYIAYQQDSGILIAAETEYDSAPGRLKEDFDKLLYVRSPIKVFMFWLHKNQGRYEDVVADLLAFMSSCSTYSPGEIFILYCRTWRNEDGSCGDHVSWLQIDGTPDYQSLGQRRFEPVPSSLT